MSVLSAHDCHLQITYKYISIPCPIYISQEGQRLPTNSSSCLQRTFFSTLAPWPSNVEISKPLTYVFFVLFNIHPHKHRKVINVKSPQIWRLILQTEEWYTNNYCYIILPALHEENIHDSFAIKTIVSNWSDYRQVPPKKSSFAILISRLVGQK